MKLSVFKDQSEGMKIPAYTLPKFENFRLWQAIWVSFSPAVGYLSTTNRLLVVPQIGFPSSKLWCPKKEVENINFFGWKPPLPPEGWSKYAPGWATRLMGYVTTNHRAGYACLGQKSWLRAWYIVIAAVKNTSLLLYYHLIMSSLYIFPSHWRDLLHPIPTQHSNTFHRLYYHYYLQNTLRLSFSQEPCHVTLFNQ